ncbi:MAG: class I SAM-dependent methyltransferase [Methanoregulaceae archaeon]|nr:class I SAM-dependent methyltransferase [Methanoregulaceae archaeon]
MYHILQSIRYFESDTPMDQVREAFDALASEYDSQRKWLIPWFDDFYHAAVAAAAWTGMRPRILDIGAGTGYLSSLLFNKYPDADLTLLDISEKMLDIARKRFYRNEQVRFLISDYRCGNLPGSYDLVCSALSIHHLEHDDKQQIFRNIFMALNPGGVFVNAEQVAGETPDQHRRNMMYWEDFLQHGSLSRDIVKSALQRSTTLDRMEKLSVQLYWLRQTGFSRVDVLYKNRMLAVMRGWKEPGDTVLRN